MHLFTLHYLPQIKYLQALLKADEISFEMPEHFQRQTYRNRCEIYTADGMHKLVVPIDHATGKKVRKTMQDVRITYNDNWQLQHQRTIKSAYQSSSYYEYFEADFNRLFEKKHEFLADLNLASIELILGFLKKPFHFSKTEEFFKTPGNTIDLRETFTENDYTLDFEYYQLFQSRKGFIGNLSCIDLLFNMGPQKMLELMGV
jgi:hypothetical protein